MKPDAPILHDFMQFEGKPSNIAGKLEVQDGRHRARALPRPTWSIERTFTTRPVHQGYIEPHACLVSVVADGKTTIWSSSQGQFMVRAMTAHLTGIPQSDIRAIPAEIGGGFGGKTIVYLEPLATLLSQEIRPAGEDGDDPRGGDARDRARPRAPRARSRSAPRRTARSSRPRAPSICRPARCPARRSAARSGCSLCALRHPERAFGRASTWFPTAPRSRPIARRARRSAPMRWNA